MGRRRPAVRSPRLRRGSGAHWLLGSLLIHAGTVAALGGFAPTAPAVIPEQLVALVWAEQGEGAADSVDSAGTTERSEVAEPSQAPPVEPRPAPQTQAPAPPQFPDAATAAAILPAVPAPEPVPAQMPGVAAAGNAGQQPVQDELPPPPPPPPAARRPARETAGASQLASLPSAGPPASASGVEVRGSFTPPRQLQGAGNRPPAYPASSRLRNEQGRVTLRVDIDGTGRVAMIAVEVSSGYPALDRAAVEAVRAWQFEPARRDGEAVLSIMSLGITYQLEGGLRW